MKEQGLLATCCIWELRNKLSDVERTLCSYDATFADSFEDYYSSDFRIKIRKAEDGIQILREHLTSLIFEEFDKIKAETDETA